MTTAYAAKDSLVEILKNVYGQGLTNQFEDEKMTYNLFPKSDRKPAGNGYTFGVRYARAQGTGGRGESAKLPDPLTGVKDQGVILPRYIYGSIRITGPAIEIAKGNQAAFVDGLADEIDDIYQSIVVDLNRQAHWDGFGQIGRLSAGVSYPGATTWTGTFDNDLGIQYFQEGMLVDFFVSSGASVFLSTTTQCAMGCRVSTVSPSTKVVLFEAGATTWIVNHPNAFTGCAPQLPATIPAGGLAVKLGQRAYTAFATTNTPTEITGLKGIYDDGTLLDTFESINADNVPHWRSNMIGNSAVNRELSIDLMLNACDVVRIRSGKKVDTIRMGLGQRRKYANLLLPDVRFAPTVLKGGYETLTFSGGDGSLEIVVDPMTQPNMIFFEPKGIIQKYELSPLGWGNLDGSQLHQKAGYDEWDAFLRIYTNLGCEQRNCLALLYDLTEPALY
jgi:hypothetical protein